MTFLESRTDSHEREEAPLVDFPLRADSADLSAVSPSARESRRADGPSAAPLLARVRAFAADAALVLLVVCACALFAMTLRGQAPRASGFVWAAAFAAYLSFFTTVVPLVLFGKTVGMALAGLSARERGDRRVSFREAFRRWTGTVLAALGLGLPLIWTARNPGAPTPADRLSGRPLVETESSDAF